MSGTKRLKPEHSENIQKENSAEYSLLHTTFSIFLSSSMAEHSAVNRVVVGSSPTWGAT